MYTIILARLISLVTLFFKKEWQICQITELTRISRTTTRSRTRTETTRTTSRTITKTISKN